MSNKIGKIERGTSKGEKSKNNGKGKRDEMS